ncbi:MAG: protoheme IX farnesyltransferase [Acidobacteria bacterium]|nr:protoheme IX farnesyltransferase [Acidobacteriota bacterium]MBI3663234.1 protoheme IX farnesyltransferase [Acidobacteriota bacterium]
MSSRAAIFPQISRAWAYVALTKPDVTFLVVITTLAGFYLGSRGPMNFVLLAHAVIGTMLIGAGTSALNQYFEREADAQMRRTARRPLPLGVLQPAEALAFGIGLAALGAAYLAVLVSPLSSLLGVVTCLSYLSIYTPLKKRTTLATLIGAFPGAVPVLIGWAAARGGLNREAWVLYAILFLWQFPHFFAIAWVYREDYARAGIRMLPVVDATGERTFRQILAYAGALVPASMLPSVLGTTGVLYFFGAMVLGLAQLQVAIWASRVKTNDSARWLMHATVLYLPALLGLMMWDKIAR